MANKKKTSEPKHIKHVNQAEQPEQKVPTLEEMHEEFIKLMKSGEYATAVRNAKATVFTDVFLIRLSMPYSFSRFFILKLMI